MTHSPPQKPPQGSNPADSTDSPPDPIVEGRYRIVLVDDEQSVLFALTLLLEAIGHTVVPFSDPTLAVTHLSQKDPGDLCICDLRMPKLNGLQVLESAKATHPALCFVLMSAHANDEELRKARTLGVDGTLSKPFTPDDLQALIQTLKPCTE